MSHINSNDEHMFSFLVEPRRQLKSTNQFFYIIPTDSIYEYQPQFLLTGSNGNEYKLSFTIDSITCTCADFKSSSTIPPQKLCKHILFILKQVKFDIRCGMNHFRPDQILSHLERYSLSNHYVDNNTARLCKSHHSAKCFTCKQYLHSTIQTCKSCAAPFHPPCVEHESICPSCKTETEYISSFLLGSYRNLSNILIDGGYALSTLTRTIRKPPLETFHNHNNNNKCKRLKTNKTTTHNDPTSNLKIIETKNHLNEAQTVHFI